MWDYILILNPSVNTVSSEELERTLKRVMMTGRTVVYAIPSYNRQHLYDTNTVVH